MNFNSSISFIFKIKNNTIKNGNINIKIKYNSKINLFKFL